MLLHSASRVLHRINREGGRIQSPQRSAAWASIRPKPQLLLKLPDPSLTAVSFKHSLILEFVWCGCRLHISAHSPVTMGAAMEVPLSSP